MVIREYKGNIITEYPVVAKEVLETIPHILSIEHDGFKGAPSGSYIYLGCLCGSCRSQGEHNAPHRPRRDSMNALTEYLWSHSLMTITFKSLVIPKSVPISILNDHTQHLIIKRERICHMHH